MAIEDFTTYTETDPNSRIAVTASRVTWAALTRDEDAYVYADKGASYFAGNFEIQFTFRIISGSSIGTLACTIWALTNLLDDRVGISTANGDFLSLYTNDIKAANRYIRLEECDGGTAHYSSTSSQLTLDTDYYITIIRNELVGTYGTLYCYIYTDIGRTTLHGSVLSVALNSSKKDFRYLFALLSSDTNEASVTSSGYTEAIEIVSNTSTPSVTTQGCSAIVTTTATGNGSITDLGSSAVTEHGHCWIVDDGVPTEPTTADSKTTNGAGSLGSFTSTITGLTQGLVYRVRAYATNSAGTDYGGTVTFTAGIGSSQLEPNQIAVGNTTLLYIAKNGKRYYVQGIEY